MKQNKNTEVKQDQININIIWKYGNEKHAD